jgi:uncharacterized membrane protein YcaP (DUF421 family)
VGNDRSITNCAAAIITVAMMHRTFTWIKTCSPRLGAVIDGIPLVLLKDGEWQTEVMKKMRVSEEDVMAVARAKSIRSIKEVKYAILERNGSISIFR